MALVIAMFIIVGVYVGYHASQQVPEAEEHNISIELEMLNESSGFVQILQNPELRKTIL
ncbi:hypothetical protein [Candidatus Nitrosopumilus sediminis]|nr:hypothetical protein [Candidatus Nitrosopumilus sediminis]